MRRFQFQMKTVLNIQENTGPMLKIQENTDQKIKNCQNTGGTPTS